VRELAEATGLHRNTITNIEIGRYAGDQKSLEIIQAVLNGSCRTFLAQAIDRESQSRRGGGFASHVIACGIP
jgi:transcriptional regulator with XRE-family HTH domain